MFLFLHGYLGVENGNKGSLWTVSQAHSLWKIMREPAVGTALNECWVPVCLLEIHWLQAQVCKKTKAFSHIPEPILVLGAWSVSQGLFGIANRHSYALAPSGRQSSEQGKGSSEAELHQLTSTHGAEELICRHRGPGDPQLLHGGLKPCRTLVPCSSRTKRSGAVRGCWSLTGAGRYCFSSAGWANKTVKHFLAESGRVNAGCPPHPSWAGQLCPQISNDGDLREQAGGRKCTVNTDF